MCNIHIKSATNKLFLIFINKHNLNGNFKTVYIRNYNTPYRRSLPKQVVLWHTETPNLLTGGVDDFRQPMMVKFGGWVRMKIIQVYYWKRCVLLRIGPPKEIHPLPSRYQVVLDFGVLRIMTDAAFVTRVNTLPARARFNS